ncbi:hypothetical protein [uncultured Citricoccus sp.]|uniref:hypothetical protein n=1 Tax=uncultured Citricoccus sp. TaxID=614031 RepID=UPI0026374E32|nr:hypothetical protein [uncultured Citricoccus sp.]
MSFALNGLEVAVIALWAAGIICAVWATRYLSSRRSRLLLIILAVLVPVFGTLAVIVSVAVLVWDRRRPALPRASRR